IQAELQALEQQNPSLDLSALQAAVASLDTTAGSGVSSGVTQPVSDGTDAQGQPVTDPNAPASTPPTDPSVPDNTPQTAQETTTESVQSQTATDAQPSSNAPVDAAE